MGFDGMKDKAEAKKKVLIWLFLIFLVLAFTAIVFTAPLLRKIIIK